MTIGNVLADLFGQLGGVVVTEGGGRLQHVVEEVAGEDQALLGLEPVGAGQAEGDGLHGSRLGEEGDTQALRVKIVYIIFPPLHPGEVILKIFRIRCQQLQLDHQANINNEIKMNIKAVDEKYKLVI